MPAPSEPPEDTRDLGDEGDVPVSLTGVACMEADATV